jgi:hypothetical protein
MFYSVTCFVKKQRAGMKAPANVTFFRARRFEETALLPGTSFHFPDKLYMDVNLNRTVGQWCAAHPSDLQKCIWTVTGLHFRPAILTDLSLAFSVFLWLLLPSLNCFLILPFLYIQGFGRKPRIKESTRRT